MSGGVLGRDPGDDLVYTFDMLLQQHLLLFRSPIAMVRRDVEERMGVRSHLWDGRIFNTRNSVDSLWMP